MSIRFFAEVNDLEVENLLIYLSSQSNSQKEDKIDLLERTIKWLRIINQITYGLTANQVISVRLSVDSLVADAPLLSDKRVLQSEDRLIFQEGHKGS
jgi:hypothetical protein